MSSPLKLIIVSVISKVISIPQQTLQVDPNLFKKMLKPQCRNMTSEVNPDKCCAMPDLITPESMEGCGSMTAEHLMTPSLRGSANCEHTICILRNNDMLNDKDAIDIEGASQFLDEYAKKNRKYLTSVNAVKETCLGGKPLFGFPQWCEADTLVFCMNLVMLDKCPDWLESEACAILRRESEECIPYFNMDK